MTQKSKPLDTAPELSDERRAKVRREMVRWLMADGDQLRSDGGQIVNVSYKTYLLSTVCTYAIFRHQKGNGYGTA